MARPFLPEILRIIRYNVETACCRFGIILLGLVGLSWLPTPFYRHYRVTVMETLPQFRLFWRTPFSEYDRNQLTRCRDGLLSLWKHIGGLGGTILAPDALLPSLPNDGN